MNLDITMTKFAVIIKKYKNNNTQMVYDWLLFWDMITPEMKGNLGVWWKFIPKTANSVTRFRLQCNCNNQKYNVENMMPYLSLFKRSRIFFGANVSK